MGGAIALAGFHGAPQGGPVRLEEKYFESVNRVSEQFSQYIFKTRHGHTDAYWNKMTMTRRDDFTVAPDGFGQTSMTMAVPRPTPQFQGHQPVSQPVNQHSKCLLNSSNRLIDRQYSHFNSRTNNHSRAFNSPQS
ncbi:hypothetical protein CMUS01_07263 [Colletotrichum musicola]|uniref:Uncharacterized protein n=1 Tax=Colletotrichum musicola TaxID=2175873 RepID=A0A8H6NGH3_9PEZI|nr:hypothetical protein CMUS01_07263 [Colletotrichum musicola]